MTSSNIYKTAHQYPTSESEGWPVGSFRYVKAEETELPSAGLILTRLLILTTTFQYKLHYFHFKQEARGSGNSSNLSKSRSWVERFKFGFVYIQTPHSFRCIHLGKDEATHGARRGCGYLQQSLGGLRLGH